jgi:hypothetical protein
LQTSHQIILKHFTKFFVKFFKDIPSDEKHYWIFTGDIKFSFLEDLLNHLQQSEVSERFNSQPVNSIYSNKNKKDYETKHSMVSFCSFPFSADKRESRHPQIMEFSLEQESPSSIIENLSKWGFEQEKIHVFYIISQYNQNHDWNDYLKLNIFPWKKLNNQQEIILSNLPCKTEKNEFNLFSPEIAESVRKLYLCLVNHGWIPQANGLTKSILSGDLFVVSTIFKKSPFLIRYPEFKDIPTLIQIEKVSWKKGMRLSNDEITKNITGRFLHDFAVEFNSEVVGIIYTQRIPDLECLHEHDFHSIANFHDPLNPILHLMAINVIPEVAPLGIGDKLLEFVHQFHCLDPGVKKVVAVTLCKNWFKNKSIQIDTYLQQVDENGLGCRSFKTT